MMLENLEGIQHNLMLNPINSSRWLQEKALHNQIQNHAMKQQIYWAQRSRPNWIQFEKKITKYLQIATTSRKRKNFIWKIMDE